MEVVKTYIVKYPLDKSRVFTTLYQLENGLWMINIPQEPGANTPAGTFRLTHTTEENARNLINITNY